MKNLYVGNLDYNTTEEQLRECFAPHGVVESITIVRDRDTGQPRGFAFIEMKNHHEADSAIGAVNGVELAGRTLTVTEARAKIIGSAGGHSGKREHRRNRF